MNYEYLLSAEALRRAEQIIHKPSYYIVSGTIGSGKTTLLNELAQNQQYNCIPELAAEIITDQVSRDGELVPWKGEDSFHRFEDLLLKRRIDSFLSAASNRITFFDRSIVDAIPFFLVEDKTIPRELGIAARRFRYNQKVFYLPYWEEIYKNESFRPQSLDEAQKIDSLLRTTYRDLGYRLVEVPRVDVQHRLQFILDNISN